MTGTIGTDDAVVDAIRTAGLTVTHDGDDFVIGCPATGVYVALPEPGAVLIRELQAGGTLEQATAAASELAGEPVDGPEFVLALSASGMLPGTEPTADGRSITWVSGVSQHAAARLFGRTAWTLYVLAALVVLVILAGVPMLRPSYADLWFVQDRALATLLSVPFVLLLGGIHESWHWLAGRALGVPAAFRITHRGPYLAFETDLTQIVALPRRKRYGPFLAGMAIWTALGMLGYGCVLYVLPLLLAVRERRLRRAGRLL